MGSTFQTPLGDVDITNGGAELLERECAAVAGRLALAAPDDHVRRLAESVATFLHEKAVESGSGCYGFDVTEEPFDDVGARAILLQVLATLPDSVLASRGPFTFLADGSTNLRAYWLSVTTRLHDGVATTLPSAAPLALVADARLLASAAAHGLLGQRTELRYARLRGATGADASRELGVARAVVAYIDAAGDAFSPWLMGDMKGAASALREELERDVEALTLDETK